MGAVTHDDERTLRVAAVEDAFESHWSHFGHWPGATSHDEHGVHWFVSPIARLPYNAVIRTRIEHADPGRVVAEVAARFGDRPFMWVRRPSDTPPDLDVHLRAIGLELVEVATGMDLEIAGRRPATVPAPAGVRVREADDDTTLSDYEELIKSYWSLTDDDRALVRTMNRHWTGVRSPGVRLVAYADGHAVGKLFLNTAQLPERVSVYGVSVAAEARGRGIAGLLMDEALRRARDAGARRCVLHASAMAREMYLRMGFSEVCELTVYATEPVFGGHHH